MNFAYNDVHTSVHIIENILLFIDFLIVYVHKNNFKYINQNDLLNIK